jgi:hypothetical protein
MKIRRREQEEYLGTMQYLFPEHKIVLTANRVKSELSLKKMLRQKIRIASRAAQRGKKQIFQA